MAKAKWQESQRGMGMWSWNQAWCTYLCSLENMRGRSSLKQPSKNWFHAHWGTGSDQGKWCRVQWKVTGKRKSHFPSLLISVSQSTSGLNFPMWGALCCGEKKLVLNTSCPARGGEARPLSPDMWGVYMQERPGKIILQTPSWERGSWKCQQGRGHFWWAVKIHLRDRADVMNCVFFSLLTN